MERPVQFARPWTAVQTPSAPSPTPASTGAVECLEAVASVLDHAVATLRGEAGDDLPRDRESAVEPYDSQTVSVAYSTASQARQNLSYRMTLYC